jgi:citrate lyase subunit beta / citryl-CoA lyase
MGRVRGSLTKEVTLKPDLPVWRSLLFVPVTQRRFVDGAARRGADGIILDLEDSVAASEKDRARTLVPEAAEIVSRGGADVLVRINRPLRMTVRDLEAVIGPRVQAIALPKADSAEHVRLVCEIIDELEAERGMAAGTTKLLAMVETADAFFRFAEIAKSSPRLVALNLGAEDFALSAGMPPTAEALLMPKQVCVFAARAAGIMPMGFVGTVAEFHDLDAFRETVRRSRRLGFVGASVIHPSQVAILNEEFRPSAEEVDHASRVVAAYGKALAEGVGAVTVDGKMIDVPVVERARLLLDREAAIAAREARMREAAGREG